MWSFKPKFLSPPKCAITYSDQGYTLCRISEDNRLILFEQHVKNDRSATPLTQLLQEDVEKYQLVGAECALILLSNQYQLLQVDAADVPEHELAKALKWRLKGLIEYPLNDIAVDACLIPPHGVAEQRKKAYVAVTLLSALNQKLSLLADAYLKIKMVSIAEMSLIHLCSLIPNLASPLIVVSQENSTCRLHLLHQNALYLERTLHAKLTDLSTNQDDVDQLVLEIQRSNDYCLSELKLPEPKMILFTPQFSSATLLLNYLTESAIKPFQIMDLNALMSSDIILDLNQQAAALYPIGGAVMLNLNEQKINDETTA